MNKDILEIAGGFVAGMALRNTLAHLLQKGLRWLLDKVQ